MALGTWDKIYWLVAQIRLPKRSELSDSKLLILGKIIGWFAAILAGVFTGLPTEQSRIVSLLEIDRTVEQEQVNSSFNTHSKAFSIEFKLKIIKKWLKQTSIIRMTLGLKRPECSLLAQSTSPGVLQCLAVCRRSAGFCVTFNKIASSLLDPAQISANWWSVFI